MNPMILSVFLALAQGQGPGQQIQIPPTEAWSDVVNTVALSTPIDGSIKATVRVRTDTKKVKIGWRIFTAFPDLMSGIETHTQEFTPTYWPTYACGAGPDAIYVAGRNGLGRTVLERWDFDTSGLGAPGPGFQPAPRVTVTVLLNEAVPGRDTIAQMRKMLHDPTVLMVRYLDSRDVYAFDTVTLTQTQIAGPGPTEPLGVLLDSGLAGKFSPLIGRDHVQYGYVYMFGQPHSKSNGVTLVLFDSNRDGVLDGSIPLDQAGWAAGDWSNPENYN